MHFFSPQKCYTANWQCSFYAFFRHGTKHPSPPPILRFFPLATFVESDAEKKLTRASLSYTYNNITRSFWNLKHNLYENVLQRRNWKRSGNICRLDIIVASVASAPMRDKSIFFFTNDSSSKPGWLKVGYFACLMRWLALSI